jgi:glycosyltransferase involved in cell wall biosynthesis
VHIGRIAFEKNIPFLLAVLRQLTAEHPEVLLVIAGEGPARKHLQARVQELGLQEHVLFVGYLKEREQLLGCYRAGDAFVFASRTETQGLVLLEAMAAGLPVVSTAVMGTTDILDAGKGALVAAENVEDFSQQVSAVLRDPALRTRLSAEGQEYVQQWSAEQMALRLAEFYADIAAGRG